MRLMQRLVRAAGPGLLAVTIAVGLPAETAAQEGTFGIGGRLSLVRGDTRIDTAATRFSGGMLRARLSPRSAFELSLDYRSDLSEDLTRRSRDYPVQASLLLYPVSATLAPYLLGGLGWYPHRLDTLDPEADRVIDTVSTRLFGYHGGLGGELRLSRRAAVHVDYRYTFIRFRAAPDEARAPGAVPIPGLIGIQERLKLSHQGSMWTTGLTFYF